MLYVVPNTNTGKKNAIDEKLPITSPYFLLLQSNALEEVKSIKINPLINTYEFNALVRIDGDYRWHWVSDTIESIDVVVDTCTKLFDVHLQNFPEHFHMFEHWYNEIKQKEKISRGGLFLTHEILE